MESEAIRTAKLFAILGTLALSLIVALWSKAHAAPTLHPLGSPAVMSLEQRPLSDC